MSETKSKLDPRNWFSRRTNYKQVGIEGAVEFLQVGGSLGERLDTIGKMGDDELIAEGGSFSRITLPWLNIRNDRDKFLKTTAYLDFLELYQGSIACNLLIKQRNQDERQDTPPVGRPPKGGHPENLGPGDPEIEATIRQLKRILVALAKILLGLSFKNPDDMKSLILNKNVIFDTTSRKEYVEIQATGEAGKGDPSKIPV